VNKRCITVYANCAYVGFRKEKLSLILMYPCIVDYSVEIPTRCSFVIEFTIPSFFFNAEHVSSGTPLIMVERVLECPLNHGNDRSPYGHINQRLQIQFGAPDDERRVARNMLSI
jgi:hypothetical protein